MDEHTVQTQWTLTSVPEDDTDSVAAPVLGADEPRYEERGLIGRGGMGEVWRVYDRLLCRDLVRKALRPDLTRNAIAVSQFTNEARITAFLQHPGVVPVLDIGLLDDGRPFYTMQEVRGPRLREVIRLGHDEQAGWTVRRLLEALRRVADVLAMAHSRGVLHRDLKPDNIMVGEFGEVLVLDWGVARARPPVGREEFPGQVVGTSSYIAPEMARADFGAVGPHSDVFQLGGTLHAILARRPPRRGTAEDMLIDAGRVPIPPLPPSVDGGLAEICARALSFDPASRYPEAGAFAQALADWLDGRQRRERALAVVEEAELFGFQRERQDAEARALREQATAILEPLKSYDPDDKKVPGWRLEDRADEVAAAASLASDNQEQSLQAALRIDPQLPEAHDALAALYRDRHTDAERRGDRLRTARLERRLRTHNRGAHDAYLSGMGAVSLVTDPPGAEVTLYRYTLVDRRLVPVRERSLGTTPLSAVDLPHGSYLLEIAHPARATVRYPVRILREQHWDGIAPDTSEPTPIYLPLPGELGADDCYVPAGWFDAGGDPDAADGLPLKRVWVGGFALRRHPVTHAEYLRFLNDLVERGQADDAEAWAPQHPDGNTGATQRVYPRTPGGGFVLTEPGLEGAWVPDMPVSSILWSAAAAHAAWRAEQEALPWRLPHSLEWEKAGRGTDGRFLPWGDFLEPTWACTAKATVGAPRRVPVQRFPLDESPYGVRGLVGNVRDLCLDVYHREGPPVSDTLGDPVRFTPAPGDDRYRNVRGGAATSGTALVRLATRVVTLPHQRFTVMGLRLARSLG